MNDVTPSMIEAGWSVFAERLPDAEEALSLQASAEIVSAIYTAMLKAAD